MARQKQATREELVQESRREQIQAHLWQSAYNDLRFNVEPVAVERWTDKYGKYSVELYGIDRADGGYVIWTFQSDSPGQLPARSIVNFDEYAHMPQPSLDWRIAQERLKNAAQQLRQPEDAVRYCESCGSIHHRTCPPLSKFAALSLK